MKSLCDSAEGFFLIENLGIEKLDVEKLDGERPSIVQLQPAYLLEVRQGRHGLIPSRNPDESSTSAGVTSEVRPFGAFLSRAAVGEGDSPGPS